MTTISDHLTASALAIAALDGAAIERAADVLRRAREHGALVLVCGNGGSAANASHFACDLQSVGVRAVALDSVPALTARANDYGYGASLACQVRTLQEPGGVLVVLSCSGTSQNVIEAMGAVDGEGESIALLGGSEAALHAGRSCADHQIHAMSTDYEVIEDVHSAICHAIKKALAA